MSGHYTKDLGRSGILLASHKLSDPESPSTNVDYPKTLPGTVIGDSFIPMEIPLSAFGDLNTTELTPLVQIDAVYGIRDTDVITRVENSAVADSVNQEFRCDTGTNAAGLSMIFSKRSNWYRAGLGSAYRFTARFTTGVADSEQFAGAFTPVDALGFGYENDVFGILHRRRFATAIHRLTLSAAATGAESVTVTLNDVGKSVDITSGTVQLNAQEIAAESYPGWTARQIDDTVIFIAVDGEVRSGEYTYSSPGDSVGTLTTIHTGTTGTDSWVEKDEWNLDKMDGSGNSKVDLNPTKGNLYAVTHQFLGYGDIIYWVTNPVTQRFIPVHVVLWPNNNQETNVSNPNMAIGWYAKNLGNTSNVFIYGASAGAFVQGKIEFLRPPNVVRNSKAAIDATLTNIVSFKIRDEFKGVPHPSDVLITDVRASILAAGNKTGTAVLLLNPTIGGTQNWQYLNEDNSVVVQDVAGTTVSGGQELAVLALAGAGSDGADLKKDDIRVVPGDIICLAMQASPGDTLTTATGAVRFQED